MLHLSALGLRDSLILARAERRERRNLARELADYTTTADRDDLAALIDGRGYAAGTAADILTGQVLANLFRAA